MQGAADQAVEALRRGDIAAAGLADAERKLMEWVALLTQTPHRNTEENVQQLREAGWTDPQIAEAIYITALFAFFNRVADGFGLGDWRP